MHCVDLDESFQTHIFLQNLVLLQPRTSLVKVARCKSRADPGEQRRPGGKDERRRHARPPAPGVHANLGESKEGMESWLEVNNKLNWIEYNSINMNFKKKRLSSNGIRCCIARSLQWSRRGRCSSGSKTREPSLILASRRISKASWRITLTLEGPSALLRLAVSSGRCPLTRLATHGSPQVWKNLYLLGNWNKQYTGTPIREILRIIGNVV